MKRADLLQAIKITSDQLNKLLGKRDANLIDSDEIPDSIAQEIIGVAKAHQQQQHQQSRPAVKLQAGETTELKIANASCDAGVEVLEQQHLLKGVELGQSLARIYVEGMSAGFASELGKSIAVYTSGFGSTSSVINPKETLAKYGIKPAQESIEEIYQLKPASATQTEYWDV